MACRVFSAPKAAGFSNDDDDDVVGDDKVSTFTVAKRGWGEARHKQK